MVAGCYRWLLASGQLSMDSSCGVMRSGETIEDACCLIVVDEQLLLVICERSAIVVVVVDG